MFTTSVLTQILHTLAAIALPLAVIAIVRRRNQRRRAIPLGLTTHLDGRPGNRRNPQLAAPHSGSITFVVTNDPWQYRPMQIFGYACLFSGLGLFATWIVSWITSSPIDSLFLGLVAFLLVAAIPGFVQGNEFARLRVEGTHNCLWTWTSKGEPRQVRPQDILKLKKMSFDNSGGLDVRDHANKRIFRVQRIAPGYDELVAFLQDHRPDLPLPAQAEPGMRR